MTQDPFAPRPGSSPGGYSPPPAPYGSSQHGSRQPGSSQQGSSSYGPQPGQQGGSPHGGGPYGPPPGHPGPAGPPSTEPKAGIALLCAVLAWTPLVPFIGAIAALILARSARRDILASGGRLTGLSMCTWATVLSWVHLAFVGLLFLFVVVLLVLGFALPFGMSAL